MNAAEKERQLAPGSPELLRRIDALWREGSTFLPALRYSGRVLKYRSADKEAEDRDRREQERVDALRASRQKK